MYVMYVMYVIVVQNDFKSHVNYIYIKQNLVVPFFPCSVSLLTLEMTCGCDDVMQTDICDVTHCPRLHCYSSMVLLDIFQNVNIWENIWFKLHIVMHKNDY